MPIVNIQDKFIVRSSEGGGISTPSNVAISNKSSSGFTVTWNAVASALGYKLDAATDSGFTSFVTGYNAKDVAGTSQAVTGLTQNTTYYVRVRAVAAGSNSGSVSDSTEAVSATTFSSLGNGLQAFYKLDDTTDASGNGNTLTNNGGVSFSSGKIGNAADIDSTKYLQASNVNTGSSAASFFCWAKINGYSAGGVAGQAYAMAGLQNAGVWFFYCTHTGHLRLDGNIGSGWLGLSLESSNSMVPDNQWVHVGFTYDGSNAKLYLNGNLEASQSYSGNFSNSTNDLYIGKEGSWNSVNYLGQIDAVGVWDRALTSGEIAELYNSGNGKEVSGLLNGLQAFYKLDDTTDASGNGNTLTNNGGVTFSSGKIGNAAVFDGDISKYLSFTASNIGGNTATGFSFSAWFKSNQNVNYVIANACNSDSNGWFFGPSAGGSIYFLAGAGSWSIVKPVGNWSVGQWTHFAFTSDASGNLTYYVDGTQTSTDSNVSWTPGGLKLANNLPNDGTSFDGQIDAVGIWNRALTSGEIAELYNSGSGLE